MNEEANTPADDPQTENAENPMDLEFSDSELEGVTGGRDLQSRPH